MAMYPASHPANASMNGMGNDLIDGSGTINPAALNTAGHPSTSITATGEGPRGIKRSRSPEPYGDPLLGEGDNGEDQKRRKRGNPQTYGGSHRTHPLTTSHLSSAVPQSSQVQTPRVRTEALPPQPDVTPTQKKASPPTKTTPTKPLVKALPTVRDHTTDQLGPEGDEYIPREYDDAGEAKVDAMGHPQDGRQYRCRTFYVPKRGQKLFMLATECARVLGYRDSYLLFNKNRSLFKIIATQAEKDDLISQDILPYSYRSRQIAIVTAKSMFRQFGSRLVINGRRVRDDYWESKARKQGFTEEDLAGEKRPGAAKARDAAAAEAAHTGVLPTLTHGDVIYSNGPHMEGIPPQTNPGSLAPLPMIQFAPTDDPRMREFSSIPRPRQEMTGAPYQDRTQTSPATEILNQASHAADFNKILNQQKGHRGKYLEEYWSRPREPVSMPLQQTIPSEAIGVSQAVPSPQIPTSGMINPGQVAMSHAQAQMMGQQGYSQQQSQQHQQHQQQQHQQQQHQQAQMTPSPARGMPQNVRPDQLQHRSSGLSLGSSGTGQSSPYGYPGQAQMWGQPPPQPQQSPMAAQHGLPQYAGHVQQQSPHPSQSPHHPSPQMHHQQSAGSIPGGINYGAMAGGLPAGYPGMGGRAMYQPNQNPQQFMPQSTGGQHPGMSGWAGQPPQQQPHGSWSGY